MLISEKNLSIDFAKKELEGTRLLKPINELQYNIEMFYALSAESSALTRQYEYGSCRNGQNAKIYSCNVFA